MTIKLCPGSVTLEDWQAIYKGKSIVLDENAWQAIDAAHSSVQTIIAQGQPIYGINTGFGKLATIRIDNADLARLQRNIVLSHAAGVGAPMPAPQCRLMMALKLASLARGASGVSRGVIHRLLEFINQNLIPWIPCQGSVGASGDLAPLSHLAACMIGEGYFCVEGNKVEAATLLKRVGLVPLELGAKEGLALLNGTQFSTAYALSGLFGAYNAFYSVLITGALTTDAARGSDTPFDERIHHLRGHRGQIEVARVLRLLMRGSEIRDSHRSGDTRVQDPYCVRCQPQVMGAILDLLQHVATTLTIEANGISDNPLIFPETNEALSGGNFHAEPVAFAADMIAIALCEIGSLTERRIAMITDPALSGLPAFLTPKPGLNSGYMIPQVTAAALVSENKQRAYPASVDSIPTSANQEDHVSMAAHGARRLISMVENLNAIIAIEYLAAVQGCDFHRPLTSSILLETARSRLREVVQFLEDDRYFATDIAIALRLVESGFLAKIAVDIASPT